MLAGMRYDVFLFDLDGTVLDTIATIAASLRYTLRHHLAWEPDYETLVSGVGTPLFDQLAVHATAAGRVADAAAVAEMVETYRAHNLATHDAEVRPFPDAAATLEGLRSAGVRLGIVTSKPNALARRGLSVSGLADYFEVVVGADDVTRPKPAAEPVERALAALGAPREAAVFVGDSPHDMLAGRAAGVSTGAALWGPFSRAVLAATAPTYWLDSLTHLMELRR